jgi:hypothetical protein
MNDEITYSSRLTIGFEWEKAFQAREWCNKIPYLPFKANWLVKVIPPFGFAVARFLVSEDGKNSVSIYLDCYDNLGYMGEPYWELYPYENGDTFRCKLNEVNELIEAISCSLLKIKNENNNQG